ncbi:MAG: hypothetical protein LRZ84_14525 [Desertifilum sp.]|nr:hypothetical protein [Desertifilum sp.]
MRNIDFFPNSWSGVKPEEEIETDRVDNLRLQNLHAIRNATRNSIANQNSSILILYGELPDNSLVSVPPSSLPPTNTGNNTSGGDVIVETAGMKGFFSGGKSSSGSNLPIDDIFVYSESNSSVVKITAKLSSASAAAEAFAFSTNSFVYFGFVNTNTTTKRIDKFALPSYTRTTVTATTAAANYNYRMGGFAGISKGYYIQHFSDVINTINYANDAIASIAAQLPGNKYGLNKGCQSSIASGKAYINGAINADLVNNTAGTDNLYKLTLSNDTLTNLTASLSSAILNSFMLLSEALGSVFMVGGTSRSNGITGYHVRRIALSNDAVVYETIAATQVTYFSRSYSGSAALSSKGIMIGSIGSKVIETLAFNYAAKSFILEAASVPSGIIGLTGCSHK